jgi:hypothetical protein
MRSTRSSRLPAATLLFLSTAAEAADPIQPPLLAGNTPPAAALEALLAKAGDYVSRYADTFSNIVAEERGRQWWQSGETITSRTTLAEMVFVRLPGPLPWGTFRDVFERDGRSIRPRDRRLEALFVHAPADALQQANAILRQSASHNLGPVYRTANIPTLALLFLLPENARRFSFERQGERRFGGTAAQEISFKEQTTPTLVHDHGNNDTPARGRFWIDASRGAVLRSEVSYRVRGEDAGFVATEYRSEPRFDILVPGVMSELYLVPGGGRIEASSQYSKYRRFSVSVEEKAAPIAPARP